MPQMQNCLWFDREAEEVVRLYVSLFDNSRILRMLMSSLA